MYPTNAIYFAANELYRLSMISHSPRLVQLAQVQRSLLIIRGWENDRILLIENIISLSQPQASASM
jgi:hypothetical protein